MTPASPTTTVRVVVVRGVAVSTGRVMAADQVTWRIGNHMPINVYEGDRPICQCHTPEDAARIVAAVNGAELGVASSVDLVTALRNYGVPDIYWRTLVDHISALRREDGRDRAGR